MSVQVSEQKQGTRGDEDATARLDPVEVEEEILVAEVGGGEATIVVGPEEEQRGSAEVMSGDDFLNYRLLSGTGARVGRFVVHSHLDEGGMGLIYRAHDEELDRPVALKILRASQSEGELGQARLIREAQALARLSHPNVVTVYEVGEWEGHIFVAMELIEGMTLGAWLDAKERSWREIIDMFIQAGRGLAAAHSVGIVHRDFKLSNALIGDDGRLRVLDFGIALAAELPPSVDTEQNITNVLGTKVSLLSGSLTVGGAIAGTPTYMSPEQLVGGKVDARADQYAFCVALYRGLYRQRPFQGRSIKERRQEFLDGAKITFPPEPRVPPWLRRIVCRGLEVEPECRYLTMDDLLADLANDRTRRRRWVLGASLGGALLLGGGYIAAQQQVALSDPCRDVGDELAGVWGEQQRTAISRAIEDTGLAYGAVTWQRLDPLLGGYAEAWIDQRVEACESHRSGLHDAALYGLEVGCLDRRRAAFRALVRVLVETDAEVLIRAIQAAKVLPSVAACGDIGVLTAKVALPVNHELAVEVERLHEVLAEASVEAEMYRHQRGLRLSTEVLARSEVLGYTPLQAEALFVHGRLLRIAGDFEAADEALNRGVWRADVIGDDEQLAETMAMLIRTLTERGEYDRGFAWRPHAEAVIERLGGDSPGEAKLLGRLCDLLSLRGRDEEAIELGSRALEISERLYGNEDPRNVNILAALGSAYDKSGEIVEAGALFDRALRISEREYGLEHPAISMCLNNIGVMKERAGDVEGAARVVRRSLRIREAALGPEHPSLALMVGNLGIFALAQGKNAEAQAYMERALAIHEKTHGLENRLGAIRLQGLAAVSSVRGDNRRAAGYLERALVICEATLEEDALLTLQIVVDLGELQIKAGEIEQGLRLLERGYRLSKGKASRQIIRAEAEYLLVKTYRSSAGRRSEAREVLLAALADFEELYGDEVSGQEHREMIEQLELWAKDLAGPSTNSRGEEGVAQGP